MATPAVSVSVQLQVGSGAPSTISVRAIGDSVTAGFGYYEDGSAMTIEQLLDCRPGSTLYDACSSNSLTTSNDGPLQYAPDYGLSNGIAWPANWARANGITNFANYAVTGSTPGQWAPGGAFYRTTQAVESAAPDYVVFTLGANPLLSNMLFGIDNMGCAIWSDLFGDFTTCVLNAFRTVDLQGNLAAVYADLLRNTPSSTQILAMQYHIAVPSIALAYSSKQIERMTELVNQTIAQTVAATRSARIKTVAPPRFDVGIDMTPLARAGYSCFSGGFVDGPSVQSSATQWELQHDPLGGPFCPGPDSGPPWIISADTGIHPSVAGHAQMASALPVP
jgi:lysophospholipase L1-like esterase